MVAEDPQFYLVHLFGSLNLDLSTKIHRLYRAKGLRFCIEEQQGVASFESPIENHVIALWSPCAKNILLLKGTAACTLLLTLQ
ncbi:hypothetical protein VNO80_28860 [Phaseolus coccineus]|uniref:Uncharacterized protein n=1 Tax=Phaseolus coccineus TaxID=3886 RepID=A0AAN9LDB3_PHACN